MQAEHRARAANRITLIGFFVNLVLLGLKFAAGFFGRSQAMVADAVHTLTDFITDALVLIGVRFSLKPRDLDHPYGHGKYETLTAFLIALALGSAGVGIGWDGLMRILDVISTQTLPPQPSPLAFYAAVLSIAAKEILYQVTVIVGRRIHNASVVANAWHHRSDALSSIGTAVGVGAAAFLGEAWTILDPLAALAVSGFIIKVAFDIARSTLGDLTDKTLNEAGLQEIRDLLTELPGVSDPHNLRCRKVGTTLVLEVHVRMDGRLSLNEAHELSRQVEDRLRTRLGNDLIPTIHMEPEL